MCPLLLRPPLSLASTTLGLLLWASSASATDAGAPPGQLPPRPADVIAEYCGDAARQCTRAPLHYEKTVQLPIAFDYDTGWVPNSSALQVRFYVKVPADTTVKLDGFLETQWPEAMKLTAPPARLRGGYLGFDYGLEVGAQVKFSIAGINWQGNIPYFPQINWHLAQERFFDSWAFPPDAGTASAFSPQLRLFEVNLLALANIPSAVAKGGVALDLKGELKAEYTTERLRVELAEEGDADIVAKGGAIQRRFPGGAFVEYDVWPEGRVDYDGVLHLLPTAFVEVLGIGVSFPLFDIPIGVPLGGLDFDFDPVRVHVPLPDIEPLTETGEPYVLDFGAVPVGKSEKRTLTLNNLGEALALAGAFVEAQHAQSFTLLRSTLQIDPEASDDFEVRFRPTKPGSYDAALTFVTNDPDQRFVSVRLLGTATERERPDYGTAGSGPVTPDPEEPDAGTFYGESSGEDGGCACRAAPARAPLGSLGGAGLALTLGLTLARRRARP